MGIILLIQHQARGKLIVVDFILMFTTCNICKIIVETNFFCHGQDISNFAMFYQLSHLALAKYGKMTRWWKGLGGKVLKTNVPSVNFGENWLQILPC